MRSDRGGKGGFREKITKKHFMGSLSCGGDKLADIGYKMKIKNFGGQVHYTKTPRRDLIVLRQACPVST